MDDQFPGIFGVKKKEHSEATPRKWKGLPPKERSEMERLFGTPALVAYNDAYRVFQRYADGCEQTKKGFVHAAYDITFGKSEEEK